MKRLLIISLLVVVGLNGFGQKTNALTTSYDSTQSYFPLSFFPEIDYIFNDEDSSTKLVSTTIGLPDKGDTSRMYAKIIPNEFDTSRVRWYSKHLYALNEPLLFNKSTNKDIFRFLWLRTFNHPISIRVEKDSNEYMIYWKVCNGFGGYSPGTQITNKKKKINKEDWDEFQQLLAATDYWKLQNNGDVLGTDGSRWILEGLTSDRYNVVDRYSPNKLGAYYDACYFLVELTRLNIKKTEIY